MEDRKKKRTGSSDSGRKRQANPGKKGKMRRRVDYPSPHSSSSDEEWIPGMSPDLARKQKGKKSG